MKGLVAICVCVRLELQRYKMLNKRPALWVLKKSAGHLQLKSWDGKGGCVNMNASVQGKAKEKCFWGARNVNWSFKNLFCIPSSAFVFFYHFWLPHLWHLQLCAGWLMCLQGKSCLHVYLPSYLVGAPVHRRVGVPPLLCQGMWWVQRECWWGHCIGVWARPSVLAFAHHSVKEVVQIVGQGNG